MVGLVIHPELTVHRNSGDGYYATWQSLRFLVSVEDARDGNKWLHASVSRHDHKLPSYEDLKALKRLCMGDHRTAVQIFPPAEEHVDLAPVTGIEVLHLWSCLDRPDFIPDMRGPNGTL